MLRHQHRFFAQRFRTHFLYLRNLRIATAKAFSCDSCARNTGANSETHTTTVPRTRAAASRVTSEQAPKTTKQRYHELMSKFDAALNSEEGRVDKLLQAAREVDAFRSFSKKYREPMSSIEYILFGYLNLVFAEAIRSHDIGAMKPQCRILVGDTALGKDHVFLATRAHLEIILSLKVEQQNGQPLLSKRAVHLATTLAYKSAPEYLSHSISRIIFNLTDLVLFDKQMELRSSAVALFRQDIDAQLWPALVSMTFHVMRLYGEGHHSVPRLCTYLATNAIQSFENPNNFVSELEELLKDDRKHGIWAPKEKLEIVKLFEQKYAIVNRQIRPETFSRMLLQALMLDQGTKKEMIKYLKSHPRQELSPDLLARILRVSPSYGLFLADKVDPVENENILWNGKVIMERLFAGCSTKNERVVKKVFVELARRRQLIGNNAIFGCMAETKSQLERLYLVDVMVQQKLEYYKNALSVKAQWAEIVQEQVQQAIANMESKQLASEPNKQDRKAD